MNDETESLQDDSEQDESEQLDLQAIPDANVIDRENHCISRRDVPDNVLKILYRLHRSGYRAYLCGGSVRDLLMKRTPKDFDVVTDAHPFEVRRLFRNSRIIGRRFRLVHVLFQESIVEVSTFRREPENRDEDDLLVTDDNTFGTPFQDARRRDFTINGMFYNIADFTVIDYVGGLEDLDRRVIRVIGDPDVRFREDPVRMLRAVEFASRLDFTIEPGTWAGIERHRGEILKASPPRVAEEILELLRRGWSRGAMRLLLDTALLEPILPEIYRGLHGGGVAYFWKMLEVLDRTVQTGRRVSDAVLLGVLLLPYVIDGVEREEEFRGARLRVGDVVIFMRELIQPICQRFAFSAGTRHQLEQALETLWRLLEPPSDRRSMWRFVFREHFADGMALFEIFALSSGRYVETYRQWQSFAQKVRRTEEPVAVSPAPKRRRRPRRNRSPRTQ
ncbi:MAG: polynucleotide adenylyltransferase PcnB [Thermoanaerobaculia bacterium]